MIEEGLRDVRASLTEHRAVASRLPGFDEVAALHREAAQLVGSVLYANQDSLAALADATGAAKRHLEPRARRDDARRLPARARPAGGVGDVV